MEEIKVSINEDYMLDYINVYGENVHDYISKGEYYFKFGKIYGIICEQGAGGEVLSQIITNKLFDEIAPKYADRQGGYTRIVKIGLRKGDAAMEVLLELV